MNKRSLILLSISLLLIATSCKKDFNKQPMPAHESPTLAKTMTVGAFTSPQPYNINVVYFIPQGVGARPDYERRVSQTMLAAQEFYRQNMYNWGYGDRTFGLLKNPLTNLIKINVVNGQYPMATYNYYASGQILAEVNAWFAAHPADRTSAHTIIFTATPSYLTEIPYFGLGRDCFVGDNEDTDIQYFDENSDRGNRAKTYMGGFLHELGHGMNLPHDALPKSQKNVPGFGTSLMGTGSQTYGYSSTILTKASCAVLNNCQLFAQSPGSFYTGGKTFTINSINYSYSNGRIKVWGACAANAPINAINSYFSPGSGYYAVSGSSSPSTNFFSYVDVADLYYPDRNNDFVLQGEFADGSIVDAEMYKISFTNGVPNPYLEYNPAGWGISSSSQYSAYPAALAVDGDVNTYWHTNYQAGSVQTVPVAGQPQNFPYFFDMDMLKIRQVAGVSFIQHQSLVRTAKTVQIYTRATLSDGWALDWYGDLSNVTVKQFATFAQKKNVRYIRIVFYSSFDGQPYVAVPEIGVTI